MGFSSTKEFWGLDVLTWATIALAVATVALVLVAWYQLKAARIAAEETAKSAKETAKATEASAAATRADHLRRRGEATMRASVEFVDNYSKQHNELLRMARKNGSKVKALINEYGENHDAAVLVQEQLDALEILATGARLKIYDKNIILHMAGSLILQLGDRTASFRSDFIAGRLDSRPAQPTAYANTKWLIGEFDKMTGEGAVELDGTLTGID